MSGPPHLTLVADVGRTDARHVGDEAMLVANLEALARHLPGARVSVVSPQRWEAAPPGVATVEGIGFPTLQEATEEESERLLREVTAGPGGGPRSAAAARLVATLAASDALLVSGGGNLRARWPEHLYERLALADLATQQGRPVAFVGQTLGPELTARQRELLGTTLRRAAWVGVRDLSSAALALALGAPASVVDHQLDDAFLLAPQPPSNEETRGLPDLPGSPWIALTLHPFTAARAPEVDSLTGQLADLAAALDARLVLLPHEACDHRFALELRARLERRAPVVLLPVLPPGPTRWLTGRASLVISTRYHPLVFGLSGAVPCLALSADGYGRVKALGALRQTGQQGWWLSLADAADGALLPRALELWQRRAEVRTRLLEQRPVWEARETSRWRRLLSALGLAAPVAPGELGWNDPGDPLLLGHPPRALALALAAALDEDQTAALAEVGRSDAEREWIVSTRAWKLRALALRCRPLAALYHTLAGRSGASSRATPLPRPGRLR